MNDEKTTDLQVELILPSQLQKCALKLKSLSQQQANEIYGWLDVVLHVHNHDRDPAHVPYKFTATLQDIAVVIQGDLTNSSNTQDIEDLMDAVETLGKSLTYLNPGKTDQLLKELEQLRKKEAKEEQRKKEIAKGQTKNCKKYLRLAKQYGLDPNLIFANPESVAKKSPTTLPANDKKSPKKNK